MRPAGCCGAIGKLLALAAMLAPHAAAQGEATVGRTQAFHPRVVLQDFVRLSDSRGWGLLESYYQNVDQYGLAVEEVAYMASSSPVVGRVYAELARGFVRDLLNGHQAQMKLDISQPLYIVELGAGSGKLAFYVLKALEEMGTKSLGLPLKNIVYVMTDITEKGMAFWEGHEKLKPYFESGQLDSALFNVLRDESITCRRSGKVLAPGSTKSPLVFIANNLFSQLPHDLYRVWRGSFKEGVVSIGSRNVEEPDPNDPNITWRMDNRHKFQDVDPTGLYQNEGEGGVHIQRVFNWYTAHFRGAPSATYYFPIGPLRALERLARISNGRMLLLATDQGERQPEDFRGASRFRTLTRPDVMSVETNLHAIGLYFASRGGFSLFDKNPSSQNNLRLSSFLLTGVEGVVDASVWGDGSVEVMKNATEDGAKAFIGLSQAFQKFEEYDFRKLVPAAEPKKAGPGMEAKGMGVEERVKLLNDSDWEPLMFCSHSYPLANELVSASGDVIAEVRRGVERMWSNQYAVGDNTALYLCASEVHVGLGDYNRSLELSAEYLKADPESIHIRYLTALAYRGLGLHASAIEEVELGLQKYVSHTDRLKLLEFYVDYQMLNRLGKQLLAEVAEAQRAAGLTAEEAGGNEGEDKAADGGDEECADGEEEENVQGNLEASGAAHLAAELGAAMSASVDA